MSGVSVGPDVGNDAFQDYPTQAAETWFKLLESAGVLYEGEVIGGIYNNVTDDEYSVIPLARVVEWLQVLDSLSLEQKLALVRDEELCPDDAHDSWLIAELEKQLRAAAGLRVGLVIN